MKNDKIKRSLPYFLSLLIIVADQVTKSWIVANIPEGTIGYSFFGDFLWIVHVRNTAVAFSMGDSLPLFVKYIFKCKNYYYIRNGDDIDWKEKLKMKKI